MKHHIQVTCKLNMELVTARVSPAECSRSRNPQLQNTLPQHHGRSSGGFPRESMGLMVATAGRDHTQPPTAIKLHPKCIGLCASQRTIRLQQNAISTNGMCCSNTWKIGQARYMAISHGRRMVSQHVTLHYRTHVCHIKDTKKERLTDTVQFHHKRITNPIGKRW